VSLFNSLFPLLLPEKTDAVVKDVQEKDGKIIKATLVDPTPLNSPVGKLIFKGVINFYENGKIKEGEIENQFVNTLIGRLKLEGKISFYENGKIKEINIAEPQKARLPVGVMTVEGIAFFYDNGNIDRVDLSSAQIINTSVGKLKMDGTLYFHQSGKFLGAYLAEHQIIKTPVGNFKVKYVSFYENNKLKSIQTSEPTDFANNLGNFKIKGASFYENGKILSVEIVPQNINLDGIFNVKEIQFYESGAVRRLILDKVKPYDFDGKVINITSVYLDENMNKIGFDISPVEIKTSVGSFNVKTIYFYENNKLKSIELVEPVSVNSINNCIKLSFYHNGSLFNAVINKPILYQSPLGNFSVIGFYFDISDSTKIIGINFDKPTFVRTPVGSLRMTSLFYSDKIVKGGSIIEKPVNVFNKRFFVNYLGFNDKGKIIKIVLSKPQIIKIGKLSFNVMDKMFFYETGKVKAIVIKDKVVMNDKEYKEKDMLIFAEDETFIGKGKYDSDKDDVEIEK